MTYGITKLSKIQMGMEGTKGTATAATAIWRGIGTLIDGSEIVPIEENIGQLVGKGRSYIAQKLARVELDEIPATFEQIVYIGEGGIERVHTGATDSGSGIIYQYDLSTTSGNTIQTFTIEGGDNVEVDEVEYAFFEEFTLSGAAGEAVMMSGILRGRQATDAEFTSIAVVIVEEILFDKGKIFIDDTAGTIGTNQKENTWIGFSVGGPTGLKPVYSGDGQLYFAADKNVGAELTGELIFEHDATGEAERGKAQTEAVRLVRMTFQGKALTTADAYTYKTLNLDMAIQYTEIPNIEDSDGDSIITIPFRVIDSDSTQFQMIVVNETAVIV